MSAEPAPIRLQDYRPYPFRADEVHLEFDLREDHADVTSRVRYSRNPEAGPEREPLWLDGDADAFRAILVDGEELDASRYTLSDAGLRLDPPGDAFEVVVRTRLEPQNNTALEGLYRTNGVFCTQCEAQGFRKITFFPDRPDVMSVYTTRIEADRTAYPVLLGNGNLVETVETEGGRHVAEWHDPHRKPSYLFALVAGRLGHVEDRFQTVSGRDVTLRIFAAPGSEARCVHAMEALKRSMRWDEETYGREYDLDLFMIVAVDDFNFGAMENKGLNVFNSALIFASPETATDADYQRIESVVGHEYFHNWSGNRVTCRDWFQLCLKEGFTVFREHAFAAAMGSPAVHRIEVVRFLRTFQFPEDAGPMAHPVRPGSYIKIDNFYTSTVYEKGSELVEMLAALLGPTRFRRACDRYFSRNDGRAATVEDFVAAMTEQGDLDLSQFFRWYDQAGTPVLHARGTWDAATRTYELELSQTCAPTPETPAKQPFLIPVKLGLLVRSGRELPLRLEGEASPSGSTRVLRLAQRAQTYRFVDVPEQPVPSLLRGFSAPVRLEIELSDEELLFLFAADPDGFNRWEAGQRLALRQLLARIDALGRGEVAVPDTAFLDAFGRLLDDESLDPALVAEALILPAESMLADEMAVIDVDLIHRAREDFRLSLARRHAARLAHTYERLGDSGPYRNDARSIGRRRLRNTALFYLTLLGDDENVARCRRQLDADNMTEQIAALAAAADLERPEREEALASFRTRWQGEPLVMNKWLAVQAASAVSGTVEAVDRLRRDPAFDERNPNKVRALFGVFGHNQVCFHRGDGAGYTFLSARIRALDPRNPHLAAGLASSFSTWRRHEPGRRALMQGELESLHGAGGVSPNLYEVVGRILAPRDQK